MLRRCCTTCASGRPARACAWQLFPALRWWRWTTSLLLSFDAENNLMDIAQVLYNLCEWPSRRGSRLAVVRCTPLVALEDKPLIEL